MKGDKKAPLKWRIWGKRMIPLILFVFLFVPSAMVYAQSSAVASLAVVQANVSGLVETASTILVKNPMEHFVGDAIHGVDLVSSGFSGISHILAKNPVEWALQSANTSISQKFQKVSLFGSEANAGEASQISAPKHHAILLSHRKAYLASTDNNLHASLKVSASQSSQSPDAYGAPASPLGSPAFSFKKLITSAQKDLFGGIQNVGNSMALVGDGMVNTVSNLFTPTISLLQHNPVAPLITAVQTTADTVQQFVQTLNEPNPSLDALKSSPDTETDTASTLVPPSIPSPHATAQRHGQIESSVSSRTILSSARSPGVSVTTRQLASSPSGSLRIISNPSIAPSANTLTSSRTAATPTFSALRSNGNLFVGSNVVIDASTGIATLNGLKVAGIVDFTGAQIKGLPPATTVNNTYTTVAGGSSPTIAYYDSSTNQQQNRTVVSASYGGVSYDFAVGNNLNVANNAAVSGITTVNTLTVSGAETVAGALTLSGATNLNGNVTVGTATSTTLTVNSRIGSDLIPTTNGSYDLGKQGTTYLQWNNGYFANSVSTGGGTTTSTLTNTTLTVGNNGATSTQITRNTLTLGQDTGSYGQGVFSIASNGNTSASGTFQDFGNTTLGNSDSAGGNTTRVYGTLALGTAPTGNAQIYAKATSTTSINLLLQDSNGNTLLQSASTTYAGTLPVQTNATFQNGSVLTLGSSSGRDGALILNATGDSNPALVVAYRTPTSIGAELVGKDSNNNGSLFLANGAASSSLSANTFNLGYITGDNAGVFSIDSSGNTSSSGTLFHSGLATLQGGFISNASSSIGAGLQVAGAFNASSTSNFGGALLSGTNNGNAIGAYGNAFSNIFASGTLSIGTAGNLTTLSNTLTLPGLATLQGGLISNSSSSIGAGLQVAGAFNASSTFQAAGASVFGGALTVNSGNLSTLIGGFVSNSSSSVGANFQIAGNLSASSTSQFSGLSTLQGGFISNASSSIGAGLQVAGAFNASSTSNFGGALLSGTNNGNAIGAYGNAFSNIFASGTLNIGTAGNLTTLSNTFTLPGLATLQGGLISNSSSSIGAGLQVAGALNASSTFQVAGASVFGGALTVNSGNLSTLIGGFVSNASSSIGGSLNVTGNLNASSTLMIGGSLLAGTVNTYDIGSLGTAFRNIYASSSINVSNGAASSTWNPNNFSMTNGTSSTILNATSFMLGQQSSGFNQGVFYVDGSTTGGGNISASGTLSLTNPNATSSIFTATTFTLAKNTSGYNSGLFNIDSSGNISSSGTLNINNGPNPIGSVANPTHAGSISNGGSVLLSNPVAVFVSGIYAYVASQGSNALEIVDISNPANPVHKGSIANGAGGALLSAPTSVFVSGNYAYVTAGSSNALEIVDISNPANPVHKGSIASSTTANLWDPQGVFVSGNYAYVTAYNGKALEIVDISNPAQPVHKGLLTNGAGGALLNGAYSVFVSGNYAYITAGTSKALEIVDISNPANPVHKGSLSDGGGSAPYLNSANGLFVSGKYAYITSGNAQRLEIVDISNPASPAHAASLALVNYGQSVFVSGRYAYVAIAGSGSKGLETVDISSSTVPTQKGFLANGTGGALLNTPYSVFVSGNYAYVASLSSAALEIVDISGATISNAQIGALNTDTLNVGNFAQFNEGLLVHDGLNVGGNTQLYGAVSIQGGIASSTPSSSSTVFDIGSFKLGVGSGYNNGVFFVDSSSGNGGNVFASGTLQMGSLSTFQSGFISNSSSSIGAGLQVAGAFNASSTSNFGGALLSGTNNGNAIGAYGNAFSNIFASGTLNIGTAGNLTTLSNTLTLPGLATLQGGFISNASSSIGGSLNVTGNLNASGTLFMGANLLAGAVNAYDIGSLGTAFRNIYASSSINVSSGTASSTWNPNNFSMTNGTSSTILNATSFMLGQKSSGFNQGVFFVDGSATGNGNISSSGTLSLANPNATTSLLTANTFTLAKNTSGYNSGLFNIDSSGNISSSGTLQTSGLSTFQSGLTSNASSSIGAGLQVAGAFNASSTSNFGGALLSGTNNGNAIGAYGNAFSNIFASGTLSIGTAGNLTTLSNTLTLPGFATLQGGFISNASSSIGAGLQVAGALNASSSLFIGNSLFMDQASGYNSGKFTVDSSGNISSSGTLLINGGTSGGMKTSATNSTTTLTSFETNAAGSGAFYLNSSVSLASTTAGTPLDRVLFAVANNGTNKFAISGGGNVYATAGFNANSTEYGIGDFAEYVNLAQGESVHAGDVLVVDTHALNTFKKADTAYAQNVAGVVSDTGAFMIGASGKDRAPLGMAGLVHTNATAENGAIHSGDYLVTSSKPGYAMRYDPAHGASAALVGIALENLESGEGRIIVLVNKGFMAGKTSAAALGVHLRADGTLFPNETVDMAGDSFVDVSSIAGKDKKWKISASGDVVAQHIQAAQVQTKNMVIEKTGLDVSSIGEGMIMSGQLSAEVQTAAVDKTSKIFITFRNNPNASWWISDQHSGAFTVSIGAPSSQNVAFDYWIIGVANYGN